MNRSAKSAVVGFLIGVAATLCCGYVFYNNIKPTSIVNHVDTIVYAPTAVKEIDNDDKDYSNYPIRVLSDVPHLRDTVFIKQNDTV